MAGLTFRERLAGGFSLGATDPAAGAREGAGTTLVLRIGVTIADIAAFVADPGHQGTFDGTVAFAPLGGDHPLAGGSIRMFEQAADPDLKLMAYRARFEHEGRVFCLDGAKQLRRGPVWRAWRDTTTVPCRLHAGPDPTAPVAGAGILRVTPVSFLAGLTSFGAFRTVRRGDGARALAAFLRFFSLELIDSYTWWRAQ